ncbi:MAG: AAA family ATPase [Elainellaceae cyanobacterium]
MTFDFESCRNESEVESKLIVQYLLPTLGYTSNDWYQEVALGRIRLDFLAFAAQVLPFTLDENSPLSLIIEAKSPRHTLDRYVRRLRQYLANLCAKYGVLTNGKDFRIYKRFGDNMQLWLQCSGNEIEPKLEEIKKLIGRDSLKAPATRISIKRPKEVKPMKTIAIYHNKGGVGKTTVSVNLAAALRNRGYSVLLVDLDSQANSTFATGLVKFQFEEDDNLKDKNVYHVLESGEFYNIPDVARKSDLFNAQELDVIPSHISLIEGQFKLNSVMASRTRLLKKIKRERENYDFVIIDTPPSRDLYAKVAITAADALIIPSDLRPFANQGLSSVKNFVDEINEFRESIGSLPIKIIGVLPSKISTNARFRQSTFPRQKSTIKEHYELPVMKTIIFERAALSHCVNQTIPMGDLEVPDPKSIFEFAEKEPSANQSAEEFESLAEEVLKEMEVM